jgi:hypothetical protein
MSFHGAIARRCITLVVLAAGPSLWPPLSAQTIGGYERGRGHLMLRAVRERLEKDYYDPTFHGLDLRVAAARADSQIQAAESNGQIFRIIAGSSKPCTILTLGSTRHAGPPTSSTAGRAR